MRKLTLAATAALAIAGPAAATVNWAEMRDDQDLSAQQGMERSASEMIDLTRWQIFLGWITAGGLAISLALTRRSLTQTRESLDLARKASQAELQAYLAVCDFDGGKFASGLLTPGPVVKWQIKNFGQTPATNVMVAVAYDLVDDPSVERHGLIPQVVPKPTPNIPPGHANGWYFVTNTYGHQQRIDLGAGTLGMSITFDVSFEDCYGNRHSFRHSETRWGENLGTSRFNIV